MTQKNIKMYAMKQGKRIKKSPFYWNTEKLLQFIAILVMFLLIKYILSL